MSLVQPKSAQHSVHRTPAKNAGAGGGSRRVFKHFVWLEVDSVKMALPRPTHQRVTQAVGRKHRGAILLYWSIVVKAQQVSIIILIAILLAACGTVISTPGAVPTRNPNFASDASFPSPQVILPTLKAQPTTPSYTETPLTTESTPAGIIRLYHNHIATRTIRDKYSFSVIVFDEGADFIPKSIQILEQETNMVVGQYKLFNDNEVKSLCSSTHPELGIYETILTDYFNFPQGFLLRAYEGDFIFRITIERLSGTQEVIELTAPHGVCLSEVQ